MRSLFTATRSARVLMVILFVGQLARIALAHVSSFEQIPTRLRPGDTIYVTDASGREHKDKLIDLSASSLIILEEGAKRELVSANVRAVTWREHDSLANGALIGFGVGMGIVLLPAVASGWSGDGAPLVLIGAAFWGGAGAGIGTWIDAMTPGKKVLVYRPLSAQPAARVSVAPLLSRERQALAVRVSF